MISERPSQRHPWALRKDILGRQREGIALAKHVSESAGCFPLAPLSLAVLWIKESVFSRDSRLPRNTWPGCCRTAYLDHGPHNLPGLLVEPFPTPARIQALQLCGQPVMLSNEEGVHRGELGHLTGAHVPLREQSLCHIYGLLPLSSKSL